MQQSRSEPVRANDSPDRLIGIYLRCGVHKILLFKEHQAPDQFFPQFRLQHQVVLHQHVDELLRIVLQDVGVTLGDMRNKINQVS